MEAARIHRNNRRRAAMRAAAACLAVVLAACGGSKEGARDEAVKDVPRACCPGGSGLLGPEVNGPANEYGAVVERSGGTEVLWFTSSRPVAGKNPTELPADVFRATRAATGQCASQGWSKAERMPVINQEFDKWTKGATALHADTMFLAVEQPLDRQNMLSSVASSYNLYIWRMKRAPLGPFGAPDTVDAINLGSSWTSQPVFSPGGDTILFVSNRANPLDPGDRSVNIWCVTRESGEWSAPRIVSAIASTGSDMSPAIDAGGNVWFASNWDFSAKTMSHTGFDIWFAGPLDSLLAGHPTVLVNANTLTSTPGCLGSGTFQINTQHDEIFPFLDSTPYGTVLYYASNRPGGFGGYDIYGCTLPSPCVRILPRVVCYEGGNVPGSGVQIEARPMERQPLIVTVNGAPREAVSDEVITVRAGDNVTITRADVLSACVTMQCTLASLRVPYSDRVIPVTVECNCNRTPVETIVISDASGIPYFITGYWWPNTKSNFDAFSRKYAAGALRPAKFIDRSDYDYACAAQYIDDYFERNIYARMDRALEKLAPCSGELALQITVIGYTDACGLAPGQYAGDGDVRAGDVSIAAGSNMHARTLPAAGGRGDVELKEGGQRGNVILSKLRAYFTMKTIDTAMSARSAHYRDLRAQNRIVWDIDGFGVYEKNRWRNAQQGTTTTVNTGCRKNIRASVLACNDPEGRRIEIYMTVVPAGGGVQQRPLATDLLEPEAAPEDGFVPEECGCWRIEHAFKSADDAEFVRAVLERFAPQDVRRDSISIEKRRVNGGVVHVLRTGCMPTAEAAAQAAKLLRGATTGASDALRSFAPATTMQCALYGISFGTLRYPANAAVLRDTLTRLLHGTFRIEDVHAAGGQPRYRVREGWYRSSKEAEDAIDAWSVKLRAAGLTLPLKVIQEMRAVDRRK